MEYLEAPHEPTSLKVPPRVQRTSFEEGEFADIEPPFKEVNPYF